MFRVLLCCVLTIGGIGVLVSVGSAQHCVSPVRSSIVVQPTATYQSAYQAVVTPQVSYANVSHGYSANYANNHANYQQFFVPLYGVNYDRYRDGYTEGKTEGRTEELLRALVEEVRELRRQNGGSPSTIPKADLGPTPSLDGKLALKSGDQIKAADVLKIACAKCHTGDTAKGEFPLFEDGEARTLSRLEKRAVWLQVNGGTMPPPGSPRLTEEAKAALRNWSK
jgi:hypothetical protein